MKKTGYLNCPLCDCEIPLTEDEKANDSVFCPYCECPLKLKQTKDEDFYLQEDF